MRGSWTRSGWEWARRTMGLAMLAAVGCGPQEELKPDPGVSPFYPGPSAEKKAGDPSSPKTIASTTPASADVADDPLRPGDVEKSLRVALRAAEKGDLARASKILDRILAIEPVNREALYGRASVAISQAKTAATPSEKLAEFDRADSICKSLRRAYEKMTKRELDLYSLLFSELLTATVENGRLDRAVEVIKESTEVGFEPFDAIEREPKLAKLREYPAYRSMVAGVRAEALARAREAVDKLFKNAPKYDFAFNTRDLDDKPLSLDQFRGKVLLVDLWGTWCKPCLETIPGLIQLRQKYADRGFDVIGFDYEQNEQDPEKAAPAVKAFVKKSAIPYRIAMLTEELQARIPNLEGFPTSILIDRNGKVRLQLTGGGPGAVSTLDSAVQVLLDEPTGAADKSSKPSAKPAAPANSPATTPAPAPEKKSAAKP